MNVQPTDADRQLTLLTLFNRFLRPEALRAGSYATKFNTMLKWFRLHLGREPIVGDLVETGQVAAFFRFCINKGQSLLTVKAYRARLSRLQCYAVEKGLLSVRPELPSVVGVPQPRSTPHGLPTLGTLEHYFEFTFRPDALENRAAHTCRHYEAGVHWFVRFRQGQTALSDIGPEEFAAFTAFMEHAKLSAVIRMRYCNSVRKILIHAGVIVAAKRTANPEEDAARKLDGSIEWFFFEDYVFSRELAVNSVNSMVSHIRAFGRFLGRIPMLPDLERQHINRYLTHMETIKKSRATIKSARNHLLAVWRCAVDAGVIEDAPRGVRKIRLDGAVECWTPDEVAALLPAVDRVFVRPDGTDKMFTFSGVSKRLFFRSLILAGWDGAQRLGDTLRLKTDQLVIQGDGSGEYVLQQRKSRRYVRFALRSTTVLAIMDCVRSGKRTASGRVEPWASVSSKREVQRMFREIVASAQAADGIRYGSFQWLRRASVTARECIEEGAGTLAAGHGQAGVTLRHYIDTKQLPAPPMPPAILKSKTGSEA